MVIVMDNTCQLGSSPSSLNKFGGPNLTLVGAIIFIFGKQDFSCGCVPVQTGVDHISNIVRNNNSQIIRVAKAAGLAVESRGYWSSEYLSL